MDQLREVIAGKKAEADKELKAKQKLDKEVATSRDTLEQRQAEIKERQSQLARSQETGARLEVLLRDERGRTDKMVKETEVLQQKVLKVARETDDEAHGYQALLAEFAQKQMELNVRNGELSGIKGESTRQKKMAEAYAKKCKACEEQRDANEAQRDEIKANIKILEEQLAGVRTERETERKALETQLRERDIQNKNLVKAGGASQKQLDMVKVHENTRKNLEQEIAAYKTDAHKQRKVIFLLEKEGEKYGAEAGEASGKYAQALEEVKVRELSIIQLQKRISDGETKLKQQQSLYEAVRSDRNLYSKNLIESQEEIAEMKRKFKIMTRQIEQLKEEIQAKDQGLVKEHFEHMKVDKEKEQLRDGLQAVQKSLGKAEADEGQFKAEVSKLNVIINEADTERLKQQKEYETVCNERDILGTQLIKRNDELAQLYEKIKIQQTTLNAGEGAYVERTADIAALQMDIRTLRSEQGMLKASVANMDMLKHEVHQLERELLQERTKVRALSEELETQMNVHRWRKLEGSDPSTYSMIQRSHALQKQLIRKTEEVATKDALIQQKEKLYVELKAILARQPGPEVAEQLQIYQENLGEKQKQLKAMTAELNMHRSQVSDLKLDQEHLVQLLTQLKKKYFEQKQLERRQRAMGAHYGGGPTGGFDGMGEYDGGEYFGDGGEIEGLGDAGEMEGTLAPTQAFGDGGAPAHDAPPPEDGGEAQ